MRYKLMLAALLMCAASGTRALPAAETVKPKSAELAQQGFSLLAAGKPADAAATFETALAVDPMNVKAFIGLARATQAQGLPGKAIKYYREALQIEPNDLDALEGQASAFAVRGATARAQINLARIEKLCGANDCPAAKRVQAAIAKGATAVAAATPKAAAPTN
ncbi:MAG: tetratricopeptide repeat protein [Sphingomonadaceae bacterium]|nr:tetratricopeptide repeat protein [Sphingomonadaceae bacterium]